MQHQETGNIISLPYKNFTSSTFLYICQIYTLSNHKSFLSFPYPENLCLIRLRHGTDLNLKVALLLLLLHSSSRQVIFSWIQIAALSSQPRRSLLLLPTFPAYHFHDLMWIFLCGYLMIFLESIEIYNLPDGSLSVIWTRYPKCVAW